MLSRLIKLLNVPSRIIMVILNFEMSQGPLRSQWLVARATQDRLNTFNTAMGLIETTEVAWVVRKLFYFHLGLML